ncbi:uncharacterized protein LOC106351676 isoform X1 [Brassica napus]|nr:uncharacterized protein LOC106351676 isoform X1 [Brassica napus]
MDPVIDGSTTPSSLMRSLSLPILPSTATECLEGLEISETQTPLGTDVRVTMEKASLSITSTLQSDTTNQLLLTSSAPLVASYETSLLETVVPPLTSEAVIVQVRDTPPPSLASVISINAVTSDVPTSQQAPSETLGSHSHDDSRVQASEKFVPSLGSWAKPLFFKPPATPPDPSTPRDYDPAFVGNQLATLWPTLNDEILNKQPKGKYPSRTLQPPIEKLPPPELKADGRLRFPWAARLSPQSRNLYRAATPTYRLDGTPEVSIPSKVLKLGPENKDEYIIGKFHKCALPPGGLVHAVVNRIWGRSCKISCKKLGDSSFMFHIPHQPTRQWVIQRGVWHIDDCLLFVLPWTPEGSFKIPEISTLPVWANLKNIPDCCYSRLGISHVASGLGEPILTHKPRLDPTSMGEAKVLVEMELDRDFPKLIALDDKQGNIFLVNVEYTWIPSMCERCGNLGHKAKRCLLPSSTAQVSISASTSQDTSSDVPIVDIDTVMQQKDNVEYSVPTIQKNDLHVSGKTSLQTKDDGAHEPEKHTIEIEGLLSELEATPTLQQENPTASPNFIPTLPTLVDSQPTPTAASIMESSPSTVTNTEVSETLVVGPQATTHTPFAFESPAQFKGSRDVGVDEDGTEPSSSLSLTRGGRETKPPSKYQDMEWKTVRGRGKRGRRGRGSYH